MYDLETKYEIARLEYAARKRQFRWREEFARRPGPVSKDTPVVTRARRPWRRRPFALLRGAR